MSRSRPSRAREDCAALFGQSVQALRSGRPETAIRIADQLLDADPENRDGAIWAVRVRLAARRVDDAARVGDDLLKKSLNPELAGLVGHAHEALRQFSAAEACFRRAAEGQPNCAAWHYHRAASLLELRRQWEALLCLRVAIGIGAETNAILQLADLELRFDGAKAALELADRVNQEHPNEASAHSVAARALMQMGRWEEAEARWKRALEPVDTYEIVKELRAMAMIQYGDLSGSVREARATIEQSPDDVSGYVRLSSAGKFAETDKGLVAHMEQLLESKRMDLDDRSSLEYAIGKAHEGLKEYEAAMAHFEAANRIELSKIAKRGGFHREGYAANMALRRRSFDETAIEAISAHGDPTELPIFVLGMIRSGTTLAEQILSSHPMINGAGELEHWLGVDMELLDSKGQPRPDFLREQADLYLQILRRFAKNAVRVVDKQPGNLTLAGPLHAAFPNARIIHMRRNPADTAISIWTTPMATSVQFVHDKGNIVFAYREYEKLMDHWRAVIPPDRFLDVQYEELITNRETTIRRMLEFCGLPWSDRCLEQELNEKSVATPSLWQVRQPIYSSSVDRWKRYEPWLGEFKKLVAGD